MITRAAKVLLLAGIALFYTLVVFNNLTDFDSNYQFVRHVLMMDSTFPGNHGTWRAMSSPAIHLIFYLSIIAWEAVTTVLLWWGAIRLVNAVRLYAGAFNLAKRVAVVALDALDDDVAGGISYCGSGMVPDVAVANLERSGGGISDLCGGGAGAAHSHAARERGTGLRSDRPAGSFACAAADRRLSPAAM